MERSQLLRGVLDVAVLAVIERRDGYGYDIQRRLAQGGIDGVGEATIYGTLRRLYRSGLLTSYSKPSDEGPHRRYYGITDEGHAQLVSSRLEWRRFVESIDALLSDERPSESAAADSTTLTQGASR